MTTILSIETATDICSAALSENDTIIDSVSISEKNVHSAKLATMIKDLVAGCGRQFSDLNAIAVSKGPGSFTGLRIGVSVSKGIAYGLDIPIIGVNTLESLAFGASQQEKSPGMIWCPVIDARNSEVYFALYDFSLKEILAADAGMIDETSFAAYKSLGSIRFIGPAVDSKTLTRQFSINDHFLFGIFPDAKYIAKLAYNKYQAQEFEDITFFEPFYLRDFKAKNLSTRIKKVLNYGNNQ